MSSFALPLALFEGTPWQMLEASSVHEGRAKVKLEFNLPTSRVPHNCLTVLLVFAQNHDVLRAIHIGPTLVT